MGPMMDLPKVLISDLDDTTIDSDGNADRQESESRLAVIQAKAGFQRGGVSVERCRSKSRYGTVR